jgi:uncharacterized OsmC-like protein
MPYLTVLYKGEHRYEVNAEGHRVIVHEGAPAGGWEAEPTTTELLASGLAACTAAYAEAYLISHGYRACGLAVACHYQLGGETPERIATIDVTVNTGSELPDDRRVELLNAVEKCMVGNTLRMPPTINVMVAGVYDGKEI